MAGIKPSLLKACTRSLERTTELNRIPISAGRPKRPPFSEIRPSGLQHRTEVQGEPVYTVGGRFVCAFSPAS